MAAFVLTVIGDDRPGLVSALSEVVVEHGGSWERSQLARLSGKFAGVVAVDLPAERYDAFVAAVAALDTDGLTVRAEPATGPDTTSPARRIGLELVGTDRPGIVHEITQALASRRVSIDELTTEVRAAPMAGGSLFEARASLSAPTDVDLVDLRTVLEAIAQELMVDIDLTAE